MALAQGTRLGPYTITALLGTGGMGEVYAATDVHLKRTVAIKVLPASVAGDGDRLGRLEREAEVLASLNHPNIAQIHALERANGTTALVIELIPGPTLGDIIARGPIPIDEALAIARQIAAALEAAHDRGIIHRDLKPANIKVRPDGTVKVLDFGIAKATLLAASLDPSQSPTAPATGTGMILGTAAYMSPEQVKGQEVDKRSDVWAFGAVLYEMLTAKKAFAADTMPQTLVRVLEHEPDWSCLPPGVSPVLTTYLKRCLHKQRTQRVADVQDIRLALEGAFDPIDPRAADGSSSPRLRTLAAAALAGLTMGVMGSVLGWILKPTSEPTMSPVTRFVLDVPSFGDVPLGLNITLLAISPDGSTVVYQANDRLYLRHISQLEAVPIPRTEGAVTPTFSPDGQWVAFWAGGQMKRVSVAGGLPITIGASNVPYTASWPIDDTLLLNEAGRGIMRMAVSGGTPQVAVPVGANEVGLVHPQLLPGGEWVLFWVYPSRQLAIHSLITGERLVVMENGGGYVKYVASGHLVYVREGTLHAVAFDPVRRQVTSAPVPLVEGISEGENFLAHIDVAYSGALVYAPRGWEPGESLVWVDRAGTEEPVLTVAGSAQGADISPDGNRIAYSSRGDIWIYEPARGATTRLTTHPAFDQWPRWSPDGQRVVFTSSREGANFNLFVVRADGTGEVVRLTTASRQQRATSWSPDGRLVVFSECGSIVGVGGTPCDVGAVSLDNTPAAKLYVQTEFIDDNGVLSPDGRWIAYESDLSGRSEIYVRPFPDVEGSRSQVSVDGGQYPSGDAMGGSCSIGRRLT